jgi:DnaK suppressor protein
VNDIIRIKKDLLARKMEIEHELERLAREKVGDDQVQDTGDQALISSLEDINISLQNNERNEYNMILKALEMIDAGTYGICTDCNQPIADKRLKLLPNATRCLACQEAREERS